MLLRPSGTEELFRVMVEAAEKEQARKVAGRLAARGARTAGKGRHRGCQPRARTIRPRMGGAVGSSSLTPL